MSGEYGTCPDCGHVHSGPELGYICVGCPCRARDGYHWSPGAEPDQDDLVASVPAVPAQDTAPDLAAVRARLDHYLGSDEHADWVEAAKRGIAVATDMPAVLDLAERLVAEREARVLADEQWQDRDYAVWREGLALSKRAPALTAWLDQIERSAAATRPNDDVLAEELARYGIPLSAGLQGLLRHIYANRDLVYAVKDRHIATLREEAERQEQTIKRLTAALSAVTHEFIDNGMGGSCGSTYAADDDYPSFLCSLPADDHIHRTPTVVLASLTGTQTAEDDHDR